MQERDWKVLRLLARHLLLRSREIQRRCYVRDITGRITRRRLLKMLKAGYIKRRTLNSDGKLGGPHFLYQLDSKGVEALAVKYGLDHFLYKPTSLRQPMHLRHYAELAEVSLAFEDSLKAHRDVTFKAWFNEEEVVNFLETDNSKHHKLFTVVKNRPRIVCAPDAAFMIEYQGALRACYIELERGTSGPRHVTKKKADGFDLLHKRKLHHQHFADLNEPNFDVLCVAPNRVHRDHLRRAFKDASGKQLWLFVDKNQLNADSFFFKPIWYDVTNKNPIPLIQKSGHLTKGTKPDATVVMS